MEKMRGEYLLEKIGCTDPKWVIDAETYRKKPRYVTWIKSIAAVAAAACLALGCYVLSDAFLFHESLIGTEEQIMITRECLVENHWASYKIVSHTEAQKKLLARQKGELYLQAGDTAIYRYAGREDLVYLIFEHNGVLQLGEFDRIYPYASGEEVIDSHWYQEIGFQLFSVDQAKQITPLTSVDELLRLIYGVEGAEDIRSVTFVKDVIGPNPGEEERTTLRDRETITEFYNILSSLEYQEDEGDALPISPKHAERLKMAKALNVYSGHLSRTIEVKLQSGYELKMHYRGYSGALGLKWDIRLDDAANAWFVEHGKIDFTDPTRPEDFAVTAGDGVEATATARPIETDPSEDKTTVGSPPITSES